MRVDVFESHDVIDLGQLLRLLVEWPEHFFKMLHVLKHKSFGLVKDKVLNIGQEIHVDLLLKRVGFVVYFLTCDHADGKGWCHYDIWRVELFVKLDVQLGCVRLRGVKSDANPEKIVVGFLLCCELFSKLLLFWNSFPFSIVREKDDLFNDLVSHLLEWR